MKKQYGIRSLSRIFTQQKEKKYSELYALKPVYIAVFCAVLFTAISGGAYIISANVFVSIISGAVSVPLFLGRFKESLRMKKKKRIEKQFLEAMQLVLAAVSAGNSVEQALRSVCEEYRNGGTAKIGDIAPELEAVCGKTGMMYHFYDELMVFAVKTDSGDIMSCVKAMSIVGSRGGNMAYVIRNALANLRIKFETEAEISGALALPKYNLRIITVMPFALVLLIRGMSAGYMEGLYGTKYGMIVSAGAIAVIAAAWVFGSKLCDIEL